jgi:hypothetical protein
MSDADTEYLALLAWPVIAALIGWVVAVVAVNLDCVLDLWDKRREGTLDP